MIAELYSELFASGGGIAFREDEGEHLLFSHGKGRESRADGAVDPAGNRDDAASPQKGGGNDLAHFAGDTLRGIGQVEIEPGMKGHFISSTLLV